MQGLCYIDRGKKDTGQRVYRDVVMSYICTAREFFRQPEPVRNYLIIAGEFVNE